MISSGELYDLSGQIQDGRSLTDRECLEIIDECHRLKHLIEEMADFRSTKEHEKMLSKIQEIQDKVVNREDS